MKTNENNNFYLQVITPVHVGAGKEKWWHPGADYFYDKKEQVVRVIDQKKLGDLLDEKEILNYVSAIENRKIHDFFLYLKNTRKLSFDDFSKEYFMPFTPENEIKTMIRTGLGVPYIPGSSIKGAIRSALFGWAYNNDPELKNRIEATKREYNRNPKKLGNKLDECLFGSINNNLMRLLQVSDVNFKDTMLHNSKIFNLQGQPYGDEWYGGWKHRGHDGTDDDFKVNGFTSTYETLIINEWAPVRLIVNEMAFDLYNKFPRVQKPDNLHILKQREPYNALFNIINFSTRSYIEKEIEFFENYTAEKTDLIIEELEFCKNQIPDDNNSCLLKMGAGTGFHAITGNWQYDVFTDTGIHEKGRFAGKKKYKSRKISFANYEGDDGTQTLFFPMGFVKIYNQKAWNELEA